MRRSRKRPYGAGHVPLDMDRLQSMARTEEGPGGFSHTVRQVRGSDKAYTCPGCNRSIPAGTTHVVAWSNDHLFGRTRRWRSGGTGTPGAGAPRAARADSAAARAGSLRPWSP